MARSSLLGEEKAINYNEMLARVLLPLRDSTASEVKFLARLTPKDVN